MKCYFHEQVEAKAICTTCGKFVCAQCHIEIDEKSTCVTCVKKELGSTTEAPKKMWLHALLTYVPIVPLGFNQFYLGHYKQGLPLLMLHVVLFFVFVVGNWDARRFAFFFMTSNIFRYISYNTGLKRMRASHYPQLHNRPFEMATSVFILVNALTFVFVDPIHLPLINFHFLGVSLLLLWLQRGALRPLPDIAPVSMADVLVSENTAPVLDEATLEGKAQFDALAKTLAQRAATFKDSPIYTPVKNISDITERINDLMEKYPHKLRQTNQFVAYYLPTTIKLLDNYAHLTDQGGYTGDNIKKATTKIEELLGTLEMAFEKQLDALFEDKAIDIEAEISVLKTILGKEGLM